MRAMMTNKSKDCSHEQMECLNCGSVAFTKEPKPFNKKEFIKLAKQVAKTFGGEELLKEK